VATAGDTERVLEIAAAVVSAEELGAAKTGASEVWDGSGGPATTLCVVKIVKVVTVTVVSVDVTSRYREASSMYSVSLELLPAIGELAEVLVAVSVVVVVAGAAATG
jgi:hypothetical protein